MRPCRSSAAAAVASALLWAAAADAADQTTSYRVGPLNDNAIPDSPLVPPLRPRWEIRIGHTKSNLVVADGRLFFVNHDGVKAELTAVEAASGRILWARSAGPGNGNWGLAYENGRLFMARLDAGSGDDGHVTAVAADSGAVAWEVTINELYGINAPPTATGGTLYVPAH